LYAEGEKVHTSADRFFDELLFLATPFSTFLPCLEGSLLVVRPWLVRPWLVRPWLVRRWLVRRWLVRRWLVSCEDVSRELPAGSAVNAELIKGVEQDNCKQSRLLWLIYISIPLYLHQHTSVLTLTYLCTYPNISLYLPLSQSKITYYTIKSYFWYSNAMDNYYTSQLHSATLAVAMFKIRDKSQELGQPIT